LPTTKRAVVQSYSDIAAKWSCEVRSNSTKILINAYNFDYQTKALQSYAVIEKYTLILNYQSSKIQGQQNYSSALSTRI
jgi:hypothetical protein